MSVPRPAIFVAMVTAPFEPASAIIRASRAWFLAFNISCFTPLLMSKAESFSDFSMETVPTRIGCPFVCISLIAPIMASYFSASLRYTRSFSSFRTTGLFVGMIITSRLYILLNSSASVSAVPVIPASFLYNLK